MRDLDLFKLILEPKVEDNANPASRWFIPFPQNFISALLSEAYVREVRSRGYELQDSESIMKKIHAVSRWLTDASRKPFLLLYGENPGTGKTTLAKAIYRVVKEEIPDIKKRLQHAVYVEGGLRYSVRKRADERIKEILPAEFVELFPDVQSSQELYFSREMWLKLRDYPEIYNQVAIIVRKRENAVNAIHRKLDSIQIERFEKNPIHFTSSQKIVESAEKGGRDSLRWYEGSFLFMDDVGAEAKEAFYMGNRILPVVEILLERYDHRNITVITSNLSDSGIADMYGARVADRLNEVADKIAFMGESYRK